MRKPGLTSLTAHLARAAAAKSENPFVESGRGADEGTQAPTVLVLPDDGNRCAHSVARGQRCGRPVRAGQALCAGHAAMAVSADAPIATSRRR